MTRRPVAKPVHGDPHLVTVADAAAIARVSARTIRRWVSTGRLTRYRYGVDYHELLTAKQGADEDNPVRRPT